MLVLSLPLRTSRMGRTVGKPNRRASIFIEGAMGYLTESPNRTSHATMEPAAQDAAETGDSMSRRPVLRAYVKRFGFPLARKLSQTGVPKRLQETRFIPDS